MIVVSLNNFVRPTAIADDEASGNSRELCGTAVIQDNNGTLCIGSVAANTTVKLCFKTTRNRPYVGALSCHKQMNTERTAQTANGEELVRNRGNYCLAIFITSSCIENTKNKCM